MATRHCCGGIFFVLCSRNHEKSNHHPSKRVLFANRSNREEYNEKNTPEAKQSPRGATWFFVNAPPGRCHQRVIASVKTKVFKKSDDTTAQLALLGLNRIQQAMPR